MPVRIYTPEPLPDVLIHQAFYFKYPPKDKGGGLFRDVEHTFFKDAMVENIESADAIVLANNFAKGVDDRAQAYIREHADSAEHLGKEIYIFCCGDFTDDLVFDPRVKVFRYSLYRSLKKPQDIVAPTITEDPPADLLFIQKKREKPLVAFCGMGGFKSRKEWLKYFAKNLLADVLGLFSHLERAKKVGVYWRRVMMDACSRSPLVDTNFIVRSSFSGHKSTIEIDPAKARQEYLETTANADFVIAPKGDGNYSNRFIKTLAFGRIPVVVDTEIVLPLEDVIEYSKISIRVPMGEVAKTPQYVADFYNNLSEEEWAARQTLAKETFEKYLKQDNFFRAYFTHA